MLKCFKAFEILGKVCHEVKLEADLQTWLVSLFRHAVSLLSFLVFSTIINMFGSFGH